MHETISKRIFVGGLASEVTAGEIVERFSKFGKVGNLSLKTRRDESGNVIKSFAHLDLEGDEANFKKCFNTYQNTKWKGSVLQLQYAKESFLHKLEKEREEAHSQQEDVLEVKPSQTSQPQLFEIKGPAVPGTPVPGKKDWVVGKYGRVLPILKLKKSYKIKMVKYDPSKHCHAARVFKDDKTSAPADTSCNKLTWEINTPDTEITRKRKGEFPQTSTSVKKIKKSVLTPAEYFKNIQKLTPKVEEVEFVKVGSGHVNAAAKLIKSNRFDSDLESDSEGNSFNQNVFGKLQTGKNNQLHGPTTGCRTVKENETVKLKVNENKRDKKSESAGKELAVSASVSKNGPVSLVPKIVEFVNTGSGHVNAASRLIKSNRFDSDLESDSNNDMVNENQSDKKAESAGKELTVSASVSKNGPITLIPKIVEVEFVKVGSGHLNAAAKLINSNRFDSDLESDSEGNSFGQNFIPGPKMKVTSGAETSISPSPTVKYSLQKEGCASTVNNIAKFKGLGMLGLLGDCSKTCQEKLEPRTNCGLSVYTSVVAMASDAGDESTATNKSFHVSSFGPKEITYESDDDEGEDKDVEEDEESDVEEDESKGSDEEEDDSEEINEEEESMEDTDDAESEDIDDDEESDAEICKPPTDVDKRPEVKSVSMEVAHKVIRKTSWFPASEKFKNSTVPIIDMRAFRFDPTTVQKTEMVAGEIETPPHTKVEMAALRNQTQMGNKLHKISTVEVQQNKHIVNDRSLVQEDKSDTLKKASKIDFSKKPVTLPAVKRLNNVKKPVTLPAAEKLNTVNEKPVILPPVKRLNTVNKKPETLPPADRLNIVNKKPETLPAVKRLNIVNKKPVTLPAVKRLNIVNKKPVTLPAAEKLNTVNKKPVTLPPAERLNTVNKKPVTLSAGERLNAVNKKPVKLPAAEKLNTVDKKPKTLPTAARFNKKSVTLPTVERFNKKSITLPTVERLNNVQLKPVRGSVVKSVGSKTKINVTSSLVGLFKKKKLDSVHHVEATPFSLQQFFDQQQVAADNDGNEDNKRFNSSKGSERLDASDSRDQPLETLTDVRPSLLKAYKQKHTKIIKSERKQGEFKHARFLPKTGRHQNKR